MISFYLVIKQKKVMAHCVPLLSRYCGNTWGLTCPLFGEGCRIYAAPSIPKNSLVVSVVVAAPANVK